VVTTECTCGLRDETVAVNPEREQTMFPFTLSYVRYVLTSLTTIAFKLAGN
jgi:hypothetical protein